MFSDSKEQEFTESMLKQMALDIEVFLTLDKNKEDIENFHLLKGFISDKKFQKELFFILKIPYNSPKIIAGVLNPLLEKYGYLMDSKQLKERLIQI